MIDKYLTQTDSYTSRDDFIHFAVSKIKTYKECSEMYKLKYVDKVGVYKSSTSTVIGTIVHAALEYLYGEEDDTVETAEDAFYRVLVPTFKDLGINDAEAILGDLLDYNNDISHLYERASEFYIGEDAIRTKVGKVPKTPEMTGVWKDECRRLNLNDRKYRIDKVIQDGHSELEDVSITDVFAKAYNLCKEYQTPDEIVEIIQLELPITRWDYKTNILYNPIEFPGCDYNDVYLNGYIDLVCKLNIDGRVVNAVVDYKTSKEEFTELMVEHNQQLLVYAKAAEILLGEPIEYIGILPLLQKKLVYAPVNKEIQEEVFINYNKVIHNTFNANFFKHIPDTKYSPCLSNFGHHCPFLEHCWPKVYEGLNAQKVDLDFDYSQYLD